MLLRDGGGYSALAGDTELGDTNDDSEDDSERKGFSLDAATAGYGTGTPQRGARQGLLDNSTELPPPLELRSDPERERQQAVAFSSHRMISWSARAARRALTVGRCALGFITCAGIPVATVSALLFDDGTGRGTMPVQVRIDGDSAETIASGTSNVTCVGNTTAAITVDPTGETAAESVIVDGLHATAWCAKSLAAAVSLGVQWLCCLRYSSEGVSQQSLCVSVETPLACVDYMTIRWKGRSSAMQYNITIATRSGLICASLHRTMFVRC